MERITVEVDDSTTRRWRQITPEAAALITGDPDLLVLHPFEGTAILTPSDFIRSF